MSPSKYAPDFRLVGYRAASDAVEERFYGRIAADEDMLTALAEHHSADARHSFHILHDPTATWGIPGEPQIIALHIARDLGERTFTFEHAMLPLPAMAQSWLVSRGCPCEGIRLPPGMGTTPADEMTTALQDRLVSDGHAFALIDSYSNDHTNQPQITVLLRALDETDPHPFRVLVEQADLAKYTHTLREGGFPTYDAAVSYFNDPEGVRQKPPTTHLPQRAVPAPYASGPASPRRR
ncbi:hypothetical protein ACFXA3_01140 [Streptomyces sp. NPDC059456]|uniref:hypothetical protein n=1 Tax=Streptomyces sp. NPDC059456 TaxID=3346838 RepID=UPI0036BACD16